MMGSLRQSGSGNIRMIRVVLLIVLSIVSPQVLGATFYFHTDHLGTPQVVSDVNQEVVWHGGQEPFGENTPSVELVEQNLRFPGQYFDQENNLRYNYFRNYDPGLGRYVQSDPIGLAGGLNTFIYAGSSPLMYIDPIGLATQFGFGGYGALAMFFGVNLSGNIGLSVPEDWGDWRCYQVYATASTATTIGVGAFGGFGGSASIGKTEGPIPSGFSSTINRYWSVDGGWGPSVGYSQQGATDLTVSLSDHFFSR